MLLVYIALRTLLGGCLTAAPLRGANAQLLGVGERQQVLASMDSAAVEKSMRRPVSAPSLCWAGNPDHCLNGGHSALCVCRLASDTRKALD